MRVALVSLGCPKNLVDAEVMLGLLHAAGHEITVDQAQAECIIVNTCAFIAPAREEALAAIAQAAAYRAGGSCRRLIVAGCLPRVLTADTAAQIEGVDAFIGPDELPRIAALLDPPGPTPSLQAAPPRYLYDHRTPRLLATPPWTAYLKIAEGCSHRCAFCAIPAIRGPYRSRRPESVLAEARALAARGVQELVLVAQDTSAYGLDLQGRPLLPTLLGELAAVPGLDWIRLLYTYPGHITDELLAVMAARPEICRYLDLPLQHSHPDLLRAMRRPGEGERYLELLARIRRALPGVALRTSLLVGFPGETEAHFGHLLAFLREARFDRAGVFAYSREAGTPAAAMPGQVPASLAQERYHALMQAQQQISRERNQELVGRELSVLVESRAGRRAVGRSYRDAPEIDGLVYLPAPGLHPGRLIQARVTRAEPYDLHARPVGQGSG